jgi:hypothetical protein
MRAHLVPVGQQRKGRRQRGLQEPQLVTQNIVKLLNGAARNVNAHWRAAAHFVHAPFEEERQHAVVRLKVVIVVPRWHSSRLGLRECQSGTVEQSARSTSVVMAILEYLCSSSLSRR